MLEYKQRAEDSIKGETDTTQQPLFYELTDQPNRPISN